MNSSAYQNVNKKIREALAQKDIAPDTTKKKALFSSSKLIKYQNDIKQECTQNEAEVLEHIMAQLADIKKHLNAYEEYIREANNTYMLLNEVCNRSAEVKFYLTSKLYEIKQAIRFL